MFFYLLFSKRVCRSVHAECCEHEVIYKQQDIKGGISLQLHYRLPFPMKQILQFNPMDEVTVCYNKRGFFVCYISLKIRQSFFDIKEFLKNFLHIMDLCFQVVVKEALLITMLTIRTYLQLITIRSKDYLQFTSLNILFS